MKCINVQCQQEIGEMLFCPYCGTRQVKPKVFCAYCGAEMDEDAVFCDNCGRKSVLVQQKEEAELEEQKRQAKKEVDRKAKEELLTIVIRGLTEHAEKKAKEEIKITDTSLPMNFENGHEWIDLGLSVKWAACNLGAYSPEEPGDFFAWGETSPKHDYHWSNYKFRTNSDSVREGRVWHFLEKLFGDKWAKIAYSKYNISQAHGVVDNKCELEQRLGPMMRSIILTNMEIA